MLDLLQPAEKHPVGSPEWLVYSLDAELVARLPRIQRFDAYYEGRHPLPRIPNRIKGDERVQFDRLLKMSRSNWIKLIIDVVVERMFMMGFRLPVANGELQFDDVGAQMIDENDLVVGAEQIHQVMRLQGISYAMVSPDPEAELGALVTPEHPAEVIVACDAETRRRRLAGWKRWLGDDGFLYGTLHLPNTTIKLQSDRKQTTESDQVRWVPRESEGASYESKNPFGKVMIVPFVNQPQMMKRFGLSDVADLTDSQDRINELLFGLLTSAEYSAFRQRWITGLKYKTDPVTGEPVFPFNKGAESVWSTSNENAKMGEFGETELTGYIKAIEATVQHMAAQSRTPPHYLLGQSGAFPSGESLKSTETGLVAKVIQGNTYATAPWREVRSLYGLVAGKGSVRAKVSWKDPEARTLGELTDSLLKMSQLGVPRVILWGKWGATDEEINEWKLLATQEALELAASQPTLQISTVAAQPSLPKAA